MLDEGKREDVRTKCQNFRNAERFIPIAGIL